MDDEIPLGPAEEPAEETFEDDEIPGAPVFIDDHVAYIIGYPDGTLRSC